MLDLSRIRHYARAYLDGNEIGEHYHYRLPWILELGAAQPGSRHRFELFLHSCSGSYAHPEADDLSEAAEAALDTRFWHTSAATVGMEGDVWLCLRPAARLVDPYVVTSVREGKVTVQVAVENDSESPLSGRVSMRVRRHGRSELELPSTGIEVSAGDRATIEATAPWPDAIRWGPPPYGEPVLYHLELSLEATGDMQHQTVVPFGFREIWADGERLLLNGVQLMPWGDHTTPYVYERQWLTRKFRDLADSNVSIVEHHRYDPPPVYYDLADELGVFVVGANFCVGTGQVARDLDEREQELVMANHLAVADAWLRRSRNHPSILFWDITDAREPDFCVPLLRKVAQIDPTRIAEVTFDPAIADAEMIDLIGCYRLFSGLENIEASIATVRNDRQMPVKPLRVGEAGIFVEARSAPEEPLRLEDGWAEFLESMPTRNIHGLQTFFLADMDYRGFTDQIPGALAQPLDLQVFWPSQSGFDARIDPFGQGTKAAWGKAVLSLNWCDPQQPVSRPTATRRWSQELYRRLTGGDVGPLATERIPEVIVAVVREGRRVAGAQVFVEAGAGQGLRPYGVTADTEGLAWFFLPEPGTYRFSCGRSTVEVSAATAPVEAPAGYDHVQRVEIELV